MHKQIILHAKNTRNVRVTIFNSWLEDRCHRHYIIMEKEMTREIYRRNVSLPIRTIIQSQHWWNTIIISYTSKYLEKCTSDMEMLSFYPWTASEDVKIGKVSTFNIAPSCMTLACPHTSPSSLTCHGITYHQGSGLGRHQKDAAATLRHGLQTGHCIATELHHFSYTFILPTGRCKSWWCWSFTYEGIERMDL